MTGLGRPVPIIRGEFQVNLRMVFRWGIILTVLGLLTACSTGGVKEVSGPVYWPKPPEQPRFVHAANLRNENSLKSLSTAEKMRFRISGQVEKKDIFMKPFGVAAHNGSVAVTDTVLRRGYIFNFWRKKLYSFGVVGPEGVLVKPMGVAMDEQQNIYVADVSIRRVLIYDAMGMYLRSVGNKEDFDRPVGVAVTGDGSRIYVIDAGGIDSLRHRLLIYDGDGQRLAIIGKRGEATGEFNLPTHVAVAPDGTVYVLDGGNFRIQAFSPEGEYLRSWGKVGRNLGDLARPRGLAVDRDGNVYVTDAAYRNFQIFNPQGQLLLSIGGEGLEDKPGQFALPAGIAVDERDFVYVVDQLFMKIDVFRRVPEQEALEIMATEAAYR